MATRKRSGRDTEYVEDQLPRHLLHAGEDYLLGAGISISINLVIFCFSCEDPNPMPRASLTYETPDRQPVTHASYHRFTFIMHYVEFIDILY